MIPRVVKSIFDEKYYMRIGTSELSNAQSGIRRKVLEAYKHPDHVGVPYFDVAIYLSDVNIEFTKWIRPICLPMRPIDDENAFAGMYI